MFVVPAFLFFALQQCDDVLKPAAAALQENRVAAAGSILNLAAQNCVRSPWYFELLGAKDDLSGDRIGAEEAFRKAMSLDPRSSTLISELGFLCLRQGKTDEAFTLLEKSVTLGSSDPRVLFALGMHEAQNGRYSKAATFLSGIPEADADAAVHFNLGLVYSHERQFTSARSAYFKAIDLQPDYAEAYFRVGLDYAGAHETRQAIPWLYRAHELASGRTDIVVALSEQLLRLQYVKTAEDMVNQAIANNPSDNVLLVTSGDIEQQKQDAAVAAAKYNEALKRQPDLVPALVGLAQLSLAAANDDQAQSYLAHALAKDPLNAAANAALGIVESHKSQWDLAERHLQVAWQQDKSNGAIPVALARTLRNRGKSAEALALLRSLKADFTDSVAFHLELSKILSQLHQSAKAESEQKKVNDLQSHTQDTLHFENAQVYVR